MDMTGINDPSFVPRATPEAQIHVESVRAALRDGRLDLREFATFVWGTRSNTQEQVEGWTDIVRQWAEGPVEWVQGSFQVNLIHSALLTAVPGFPDGAAAYERWAR